MLQDKRQFTRILYSADANLFVNQQSYTTHLIDLSLKGALIERPDSLNLAIEQLQKQQIYLVFGLDCSTIQIEMSVNPVYEQDQRIGLCCQRIDLDSVIHLRRLIELNMLNTEVLNRELCHLGELPQF